jgi:hypothetical protein
MLASILVDSTEEDVRVVKFETTNEPRGVEDRPILCPGKEEELIMVQGSNASEKAMESKRMPMNLWNNTEPKSKGSATIMKTTKRIGRFWIERSLHVAVTSPARTIYVKIQRLINIDFSPVFSRCIQRFV